MYLEAQHIHLIPDQRVCFTCPPLMEEAYRTVTRIAIVLVVAPISLIIFTCLFHVPFIPVVVMFVIMALLRPLEHVFASIALHLIWPLHGRWLMHKSPQNSPFKSTCSVQRVCYHVDLHIDEDQHTLHIEHDPANTLEGASLSLSELAYTGFERADDRGGAQLRVTLRTSSPKPRTLSFATRIPDAWLDQPTADPQRTRYFTIPRKEGDALVLSLDHFLLLLGELERAGAFVRIHEDLTPDAVRSLLQAAHVECPPTTHDAQSDAVHSASVGQQALAISC